MTLETMHRYDSASEDYETSERADISAEEREEVLKILKEFKRYKRYRSRYDKNYMDYYKFFRGRQWSSKRPYWKNSEIINLIWQTVQSQVPLQTDVRPTWEFLPKEPSDSLFADVLNSISQSDFNQNNWMMTLLEVIYDGYIYGTGYSSMHFDPSLNYGTGGCTFKSMDPFYCYPDPDATDVNCPDSEGFFYARPVNTKRLKRKHPDRADDIKPDVEDWVKKEKTESSDYKFTYFNSDVKLPEGVYGSGWDDSESDMTFVIEGWFKPKDTIQEEFDEEGPGGETTKKLRIKRKWPNGRHVKIANGMLLVDESLEYEDLLIPFSKYNNYIMPREFHGVSEVEQLEGPQVIFNKMLCFSLDIYALTGNPVWLVDNNSDVDTDSGLVNIPGSIIEKNPNTEVRRLDGSGLTPGALALIDRLESWYNRTAGQSDLQSGDVPGGVTAASAIEQLISIQKTRVRQKQRNLDAYMKTAGIQYMNRVLEFYSVPKIWRITKSDGSFMFRKFRIEKGVNDNGDGANIAVWTDMELDDEKNVVASPERRLIIQGILDVNVKSGSSLPFEIADIERKTLALFDRGIVDEEAVLEKLDIPDREKILMRLNERRQVQARQAQAQGV